MELFVEQPLASPGSVRKVQAVGSFPHKIGPNSPIRQAETTVKYRAKLALPKATHTHQNVLIELADHEDNPLGLGQLGVVDHPQALGGILPVGLDNIFRQNPCIPS